MKKISKFFLPLLLLFLSIVLSSCAPGGVVDDSSSPEVTPLVTPGESTPIESTPAESTPVESTPPESTPVELTPENTDPNGIYVYKTLPDAFTELSAEMRAEIEEKAGVSIDWNKHYLGTHKGYVIFGIRKLDNPKLYKYYDYYFGKLTDLYGYKNGELILFKQLMDKEIIDWKTMTYISYLGLEKAVDHVPVASKDMSSETMAAIRAKYKNFAFENNYFGMCGGAYIFANGGDITGGEGYSGGIRKIQNHVIFGQTSVIAFDPKKGYAGFVDFFTFINENPDIDYEEFLDTLLIACRLYGYNYDAALHRVER